MLMRSKPRRRHRFPIATARSAVPLWRRLRWGTSDAVDERPADGGEPALSLNVVATFFQR